MGYDWVCTKCWSGGDAPGICACGENRVPFAAPGETPSTVIHFKLLDEAPTAVQLLDLCDGPRLYQSNIAACCQHGRQTVWLWQYDAAKLGNADLPFLHALRHANLALFDIGDGSGYFQARYQRQCQGENPPTPETLLTDLELQFRELGQPPRFAAAALVESWGRLGDEFIQRLGYFSARLGRFKTQAEALAWLIRFGPRESAQGLTHKNVSTVKRYETKTPTRPTEEKELNADFPSEPSITPRHLVLCDIGGNLARHLLARLHAETVRAAQDAHAGSEWLALRPWYKSMLWQVHAKASADSLRWGRLELARKINPNVCDVPPSWEGSMGSWWGEQTEIALNYVDLDNPLLDRDGLPIPMVIGIGRWAKQGERQFVRLLQIHWRGCCQPVVLLNDAETDIKLLGWARSNFPEARIHSSFSFESDLQLLNSVLVKSSYPAAKS